ncbi:hypothetical protein ACB092_03G017900 [Castanea dentata]
MSPTPTPPQPQLLVPLNLNLYQKPKKLLSFVDEEDKPASYHSFSKQNSSSSHNISSLEDYTCSTITTTSFSNDNVQVTVSVLFHRRVNSVELCIEHVSVGQARDFVQNAVVWLEQCVVQSFICVFEERVRVDHEG